MRTPSREAGNYATGEVDWEAVNPVFSFAVAGGGEGGGGSHSALLAEEGGSVSFQPLSFVVRSIHGLGWADSGEGIK